MHPLDTLSIPVIVALFAIASFLCYEVGFRIGRWWQDREPGEQEGPTGVIVGALLGLMAFLLAVTMGMASDRFDARRGLVLAEANAIGTTFLRADYLPEPAAEELRELLREYLPLRIATDDRVQLAANIEGSEELHQGMWALQAAAARGAALGETGYSGDLVSSLGDSLNELIDLHETRIVASLYARVPDTVLLLLLVGSALSLAMLGYSAGLTRRRSVLSAVVLVVALGAVTTLVIDLDRPQDGFLRVSQQALLDTQEAIGTPTP